MQSNPRSPTSTLDKSLAILVSGGLDSAILLGESMRENEKVYPLYVRSGHFWEGVELEHLKRFLFATSSEVLQPLHVLEMPVVDLYPDHWSMTGKGVPDENSVENAVFLPGRNVLLLSKAMIWCHLRRISGVALGALGSNPFPDATPAFLKSYQDIVNQALEGGVRVHLPFAGKSKREVMLRGRSLPLELTFSCIRPANGEHCGRCNKCAERRRAFADAGMADQTTYES
jgi:7-cyano-7-deazaguanine synthase